MGAVFALYSAWYFWIPKILGLDYNRMLGKVHFWVLFIGVNVTFFPQHFLGLQGMPRRISDYPDAFAGWNLISSFGSIISVVATWLFLYIVYVQLVEGKATSRYPWLTPQFYSDSLQTLLNRSYNSLEWALTSPPKPHAFVSLPLQSTMSTTWLNAFEAGLNVWAGQSWLAQIFFENMTKFDFDLSILQGLETTYDIHSTELNIDQTNHQSGQQLCDRMLELNNIERMANLKRAQLECHINNNNTIIAAMQSDNNIAASNILSRIPYDAFRPYQR